MNINNQELDRYITQEPDNGWDCWCEAVWDSIPETEIGEDAYNENEKFFYYYLDNFHTMGFDVETAAMCLIARYQYLKQFNACIINKKYTLKTQN